MRQVERAFEPLAARPGGVGALLLGLALLALAGAGALLWWRQGEAIFESLIKAAVAWCF